MICVCCSLVADLLSNPEVKSFSLGNRVAFKQIYNKCSHLSSLISCFQHNSCCRGEIEVGTSWRGWLAAWRESHLLLLSRNKWKSTGTQPGWLSRRAMFMVYLFKPVLISFVNMIGFFPRSIFNKYTVINFKWCLGRRLMSILPQMAKSQRRVNSVASKVQTGLSIVSGFLPWFPFLVLAALPLSHSLHLSTTRSCTTIYRSWFPWLQVIHCLWCHHEWRRNPATQASTQRI